MKHPARGGVAAAIPLTVAVLIAATLAATGMSRQLVISTPIPVVVLVTGAVLTLCGCAVLLELARRRRVRARAEKQVAESFTAGVERERHAHRQFLARLDHELKNPLTAIRAGAAQSSWETVDAQAAKLSTLVHDLRKLAELETREPERETVDVEQLLTEAIDALQQRAPQLAPRLQLVVTRVPWSVPPLRADPDLLAVAFDNVLGNAEKYSETGPIEVRLKEQDGWAVIDIADAGRGVPLPDQCHIFEELARAGNSRDVSGAGIGLALVAAIMAMHGGDVSLRSAEGSGTVVTMRLPAK